MEEGLSAEEKESKEYLEKLLKNSVQENIDEAVKSAENKIRAILLNLVNEHDIKIDGIEVDTRTFADCAVTIYRRKNAKSASNSESYSEYDEPDEPNSTMGLG